MTDQPQVLVNPTEEELAQLPPGIYAVATVTHPDRELTPEERAHLGLPPADSTEQERS